MRMLGTNHPQQPPHPGLLQISALTPKHRLRTPSQYKQPRRLTRHLRQLTNNTHQMPHTLDTLDAAVLVANAVVRLDEDDRIVEPAGIELAS
ncbi:hypothetical protein MYBA111488_00650 [Mycobacterium basiliense]